ncbi:RNA polymerase III subunit C82, partial [Linderina pennispora]
MFTQQFELCKRILRTHFGPIVAQVATVLIHEGRLPLGLLAQKAGKTLRQTKESVAVLIQHGIATHAPSKEGSRMATYYSISPRNVLRLERAGLYLALVEERMGKEGLAIFRVFMDNGCATIGEAKRVLEFEAMASAKQIKFRQAVAKMVNERYITAVRAVDTVTKIDRLMAEERKELDKLMVPPTAKELKEIRARIKEREDEEYHNTAVIGIKRKAVSHEDSMDGGEAPEQQIDTVDEAMFFRPYCDRLDVFLRNQQITNYFADKYNAAAGAVIKTMLRLTESKTKTCRDKVSPTVSASQVMQNLAHDAPLADSVDLDNDAYYDNLETAKGDGTSQGMTRKERAEIILALLEVLSSDSSGIVRKLEERGAGQF